MLVEDLPEQITVREGEHFATVHLEPEGEGYFAGKLESSGSVECLIALLNMVKGRRSDIWLIIDDDNPRKKELEKLYERFGSKYKGKVYKWEA